MKLGINDLKRGSRIVIDGDPYIVMHVKHVHMGRGGATLQVKIRNLKSGKVLERSFKPSDGFEEADIEKMQAQFIYERNGEYWFHESGNPGNRFSLGADIIGEQSLFLKPKTEITAFIFSDGKLGKGEKGEIINIELPIKVDYEVIDAPPNVRGNTSQGGNKQVVIEGGAKVSVPLFIEAGDKIRINTETGEYVERAN